MASSRRPYGVDHFDLVLALRTNEGVHNFNFPRRRVLQLYDESFSREILSRLARDMRETGEQVVHVAAGLFSWGDALHAAMTPAGHTASN